MNGLLFIVFLAILVIGGAILFIFTGDLTTDTETDSLEDLAPEDVEDPNRLIQLAESYENRKNWPKATRTWSRLIDKDPERLDAYFRRGICYYRTGQFERAVNDFEEVIGGNETPPASIYLYTARAYQKLNQLQRAFEHYTAYINNGDPGYSTLKTVADLARHLEKWNQASALYKQLKDEADMQLSIDATLALADMAYERKLSDRAKPHLERLKTMHESGNLVGKQLLTYRYLRAQNLESEGKHEEANRLIRTIYQDDPDFRDVKEKVQDQISELDTETLPQKFQRMDKESFLDFCRRIVEGTGYEYVESQYENPEELDIIARERAIGLRVTRVLFAFKKWDETTGEIPIKEFEFKMIENRHDKGYFVSPTGFKHAAQTYADGNQSLNLIGPDEILSYFKEWYLSDIHGKS